MHLRNENLVPAPFCRFSSGFVLTTLELGLYDTMIRDFPMLSVTCENCPLFSCVRAANLVCRDIIMFRK
jgi:hypothetical protein